MHIKSRFILNGVCAKWRGWVDLDRLDGVGCVEFDEEAARVRLFDDLIQLVQVEFGVVGDQRANVFNRVAASVNGRFGWAMGCESVDGKALRKFASSISPLGSFAADFHFRAPFTTTPAVATAAALWWRWKWRKEKTASLPSRPFSFSSTCLIFNMHARWLNSL